MRIKTVTGSDLGEYMDDLARLRIEVFREFPYLYDGDLASEEEYLATYLTSGNVIAVLAIDDSQNEKVVGASTGIPLNEESSEFQAPFIKNGMDPGKIFYCAESVLLPEYRGRGVYKSFFKEREAHALSLSEPQTEGRTSQAFQYSAFCAVVRSERHPLRPDGHKTLDEIWRGFGYRPRLDLICHYGWKDVDQPEESDHPMMFWLKSLGQASSPGTLKMLEPQQARLTEPVAQPSKESRTRAKAN